MKERPSAVVNASEKRCSGCEFGHQIVSYASRGEVHEDGSETRSHTLEPKPIGMTRNCYGWLEIELFHPDRFIYPGANDACVNTKKFKPKVTDHDSRQT